MPNRVRYDEGEQFRVAVHTLLKCYRKAKDLKEHTAVKWSAVQARVKQGTEVVQALRTLISEALDRLALDYPHEAQLLSERYLKGRSVLEVSEAHHLSERECFRKCERGIDEITSILAGFNGDVTSPLNVSLASNQHSQQRVIAALLGNNITVMQRAIGQYLHPQAMAHLEKHLTNLDLALSDRTHIISRLHDVYHAARGSDLQQITARQNSLYLLGACASLESYTLLDSAWKHDPHPWPVRAALLGSPTAAKYEEHLYRLDHDDHAREVARTFPRVFYGDQLPTAGLFQDDRRPYYAKTLRFYLTNYGKFLGEASLGLVLYVISDLITTKGDNELRRTPGLLPMLHHVLSIQPIHPLAQREWTKLQLLSKSFEIDQ